MIEAKPEPDLAILAARLAQRAGHLIEAQAEGRALPRDRRWRRAAWLWPHFTKG